MEYLPVIGGRRAETNGRLVVNQLVLRRSVEGETTAELITITEWTCADLSRSVTFS
jgi:hypothetical protein